MRRPKRWVVRFAPPTSTPSSHARWKSALSGAERLNTTSVASSIWAMLKRYPGRSASRSSGLKTGTTRRTQYVQRRQGHMRNNVNTAFAVIDVTLDAPGHAIVRTHETWTAEIHDAATGHL